MFMNADDFRKHSKEVERLEQRRYTLANLLKQLDKIEKKESDYDLKLGTNGEYILLVPDPVSIALVRLMLETELKLSNKRYEELTDITFTRVP
jgi:hypothetical protein